MPYCNNFIEFQRTFEFLHRSTCYQRSQTQPVFKSEKFLFFYFIVALTICNETSTVIYGKLAVTVTKLATRLVVKTGTIFKLVLLQSGFTLLLFRLTELNTNC